MERNCAKTETAGQGARAARNRYAPFELIPAANLKTDRLSIHIATAHIKSLGLREATMLAEIVLLRLEAALRATHETYFTHSRFVPICHGMVFKHSRTRA